MKLFSLLSLALFCIDTATPAPVNPDGGLGFRPVGAKPAAIMSTIERREASVNSDGGFGFRPVGAKPAAIMSSIERREASKMKAAIMTPVQRRALPKIKLPKSDAEKVADAKKVLTSGGKEAATSAADTAKKAARDARKAEKKASKGKKEQKVDETKKDLTEDDKKGVQEELEASKQQKKKEKEEEKTDQDVDIKSVTRKEYTEFWKDFSTNPRPRPGATTCYKGADNGGYVTASCIQAAFESCMKAENQKYLFWSSGGSDAFMAHAVKRYMQLTGSIKIADAVKLNSCKKNLAPMNRRGMKDKFHTWIEKKRTAELVAKTRNPKAKARVTAAQRLKGNFIADLNYRYYWPIMSAAYAAAAGGEVYYLRPDRVDGEPYDFPNSHWVDYELPELKKNKKVTKLTEATMQQVRLGKDANGDDEAYGGQFANMQPTKETIRIENGRVQEVRES